MRSRRTRLFTEQLGEAKQIFDGVHAQNSHTPKSSIKYIVAARERPGVRGGSLSSSSGAADLDRDNWFRERDFTRSREKRMGVTDRLHVEQDAARVGIVAEMINQIA